MANETQTNSASSVLQTTLSPNVIMNFREPLIMGQFAYVQDISSLPSVTISIPTWSTTLAASAVANGANEADAQANTQVSTSSVSLTAAMKGVWTQTSRQLEGSSVFNMQQAMEFELARALGTKFEVDLCTLLGGHSNTVGTSGQNITIGNLRSAITTLRTNALEHAQNAVIVLHPVQVGDLEDSLMNGTGPGLAAVFTRQDIANIFGEAAGASVLGSYIGSFMNIPIFQTTNVQTANAGEDRAGAIFVRSVGNSQYAAYGVAMKQMPMVERYDSGVNRQLAYQYQGTSDYGAAELNDTLGVSIITDA